jgi:hypothetical protein
VLSAPSSLPPGNSVKGHDLARSVFHEIAVPPGKSSLAKSLAATDAAHLSTGKI